MSKLRQAIVRSWEIWIVNIFFYFFSFRLQCFYFTLFSLSNYNYHSEHGQKKTVGDEFIYICLVELIAHTNYAFMVWKACDSFPSFTWWYGYISIRGSLSSVGWARKPVSSITLQKLTATCKWTQLDATLATNLSIQNFPKSFLKLN